MEIKDLCEWICPDVRVQAVSGLLKGRKQVNRVIDGLAGSSAAVLFSRLPKQKTPYLVVCNDLDEAGYLYHDLCQINGETNVLIFPSGYKRDIKYGQVDAPSEILRTEVLNKWYNDASVRWVVTFPEALAEQVSTKQEIDDSTITLKKGGEYDMTELVKRLLENEFVKVDYVYEPGQFALRGSILDVYSYSNELPYRVDFFGDEVDTIREFNVETQLSERHLDSVFLMGSSCSGSSKGASLLEYIGDDTVLLCSDAEWLCSRIRAIGEEKMSSSAIIADEGDQNAMSKIVDAEDFVNRFKEFKRIDFNTCETPAVVGEKLTLHCAPQGIYHKNFDIISQSFHDFMDKG